MQVKCDTDEDVDSAGVYEQVVANLSKQLEQQSLTLDALKQSEAEMKLTIRLAEQRALEAETKLAHAEERYVSMLYLKEEQCCSTYCSESIGLKGSHSHTYQYMRGWTTACVCV